jgi:hypothetical protein
VRTVYTVRIGLATKCCREKLQNFIRAVCNSSLKELSSITNPLDNQRLNPYPQVVFKEYFYDLKGPLKRTDL